MSGPCFFPHRRRSKPMVSMVAACAWGGRNDSYLGCVRTRVRGLIWFHRIWNLMKRYPISNSMGCCGNTLIGTFVGGLKEEIAAEVRLSKSKTLRSICCGMNERRQIGPKKKKQDKTEAQKMAYAAKTTNPVLNSAKPCSNQPVKRISWEEMPKCHEKGLCFSCNE